MDAQVSPRKKLAVTFAIALGLSLTPMTVNSQDKVVTANDACADGKCCMEVDSYCGTLVGYYDSIGECEYVKPGSGW